MRNYEWQRQDKNHPETMVWDSRFVIEWTVLYP